MNGQKFKCVNCGHHIYEHKYADPKALTKKERKQGGIPWYCSIEACECVEYIPGR
jgi:hypothetical protein